MTKGPSTTTVGQVNLFVADMDATVAFYRLLGLDVADPYDWPEGSGAQHVDVHFGGDFYIAFDNHPMARIWNPSFEPDRGGGNAVVGLMVAERDDVDRLCDTMEAAGYEVAVQPYDAFFGSRYAIVIDPDGNQVGIKSPIEPDRKYVPEL